MFWGKYSYVSRFFYSTKPTHITSFPHSCLTSIMTGKNPHSSFSQSSLNCLDNKYFLFSLWVVRTVLQTLRLLRLLSRQVQSRAEVDLDQEREKRLSFRFAEPAVSQLGIMKVIEVRSVSLWRGGEVRSQDKMRSFNSLKLFSLWILSENLLKREMSSECATHKLCLLSWSRSIAASQIFQDGKARSRKFADW